MRYKYFKIRVRINTIIPTFLQEPFNPRFVAHRNLLTLKYLTRSIQNSLILQETRHNEARNGHHYTQSPTTRRAFLPQKYTHTHTLVVYKYRNMLYPKRSKCRFYAARRRTRLKKKRDKGCARVRAPLVLIPLPDFFRLFSTVFLPCRDAKIIKSRSAREISAHIHFLPITASVRLMSGFCGTCVCIYIYTPREQ